MRFKHKPDTALYISALGGALALLIASGCKSPPAKDRAGAGSTQVAPGSDSEVTAPEKSSAVPETQPKLVKEKAEEPVVVVQKGPGDGAPPAEETSKHMKQMEKSLAPLEVVPATPPS
ncbi:hypothetical protein P4E94_10185 [Pontiellaceae bacterium B12219]|nr:hypothetical protein [Pontiellaceae bacterium B12219]